MNSSSLPFTIAHRTTITCIMLPSVGRLSCEWHNSASGEPGAKAMVGLAVRTQAIPTAANLITSSLHVSPEQVRIAVGRTNPNRTIYPARTADYSKDNAAQLDGARGVALADAEADVC